MDADDVSRVWADRTGAYSPAYYAHHGPDRRSEAVLDVLEQRCSRDAAVLELGSSAGRHLKHFLDHGFTDLTGVDANGDALAVLRETYPDLAETATVREATFSTALADWPADRFDATVSVESLQHVHPDADDVLDDVARVTGDLLVTLENETPMREREDDEPPPVDHDAAGEEDTTDGSDATDGAHVLATTTVDDEVPLYHRDWAAVFEGRGFRQVSAEPCDRGVLRVFVPE